MLKQTEERKSQAKYTLNCAWVLIKGETGAQENYNTQSHNKNLTG